MDPKKFVDIVMREAGKIVHRIVCSTCSSTVRVQLEVVSHPFILFFFFIYLRRGNLESLA